MSLYPRTDQLDRIATPMLGAREITSFDGCAANDNGTAGERPRPPQIAGWALPMAAFAGGLTAALVVTGLSDLLGFVG